RPQAILFDWDNTLVASMNMICNAVNNTLEKLNKHLLSYEQVYQSTHQSPRDTFIEVFGADAPEAMVIFYEFIHATPMEKRFDPLPGAQVALEKIKQAGIPMGVVSNKQAATLRAEIDFIVWQDYFHTVIGSGDAEADKPSPAPLNLALERMSLKASPNIWFIGDSPVDWAAAQQSGCRPFSIHVASVDPAIFHFNDLHHMAEIIDFS
ncbi:MAG: HAD-IA family hydrolase, partial [Alphaproteobacteria bacterium]